MGTNEIFSECRQPRMRVAAVRVMIGAALCVGMVWTPVATVSAQNSPETAWQKGAIGHAQAMRKFPDVDKGNQAAPDILPQFQANSDPSGMIATEQSNGVTVTKTNPFFQSLGSNDRSCVTCHQPQN